MGFWPQKLLQFSANFPWKLIPSHILALSGIRQNLYSGFQINRSPTKFYVEAIRESPLQGLWFTRVENYLTRGYYMLVKM